MTTILCNQKSNELKHGRDQQWLADACAKHSSRCDARDTFASTFRVHATRRLRNGHASHVICARSTIRVKIDCTTTFHQAATCHAARRKRRGWKDHRQREGRREQLHVVEKDTRPGNARRPRWSNRPDSQRRSMHDQCRNHADEVERHMAEKLLRVGPTVHTTESMLREDKTRNDAWRQKKPDFFNYDNDRQIFIFIRHSYPRGYCATISPDRFRIRVSAPSNQSPSVCISVQLS